MGLLGNIRKFASRKNKKTGEIDIYTGKQVASLGHSVGDVVTVDSQTEALLTELRNTTDVGEQIEMIVNRDPDVSMGVWAFLKLAFQGFNIEIKDLNGKQQVELEDKFNRECSTWNNLGNDGLDGVVENLFKTGFLYNGMICEIVVNGKAGGENENTFKGIYIIDPRTIEWHLEEENGAQVWKPYQQTNEGNIDLTKGNIVWTMINPDVGSPAGAYLLESAVSAIDFKLQTLKDSSAVLRRQGYPYNIWTIDKEVVYNTMPAGVQNDAKKYQEYLNNVVRSVNAAASSREPTQDIVVTSDVKIERSSSASAGSSIDTRAWTELVDVQVMNSIKSLGVFLNRYTGVTETWGTVQMKIIESMIKGFQRKAKRLLETIGAMWIQLNGAQATMTVTFKEIDYQSEMQKWDAQIRKDEHFKTAEDAGWINTDEAAHGALGVEKATGTKSNSNEGGNGNGNNQGNNSSNNKK